MDVETIYIQMEQDFKALAKEHDGTADNELIWALGAPDAETTKMHTENVETHRLLARMYRRLREDILSYIETYEDDVEG